MMILYLRFIIMKLKLKITKTLPAITSLKKLVIQKRFMANIKCGMI